jgi:hypothetical protein
MTYDAERESMEYDPNMGDAEKVTSEFGVASKLAARWDAKAITVPLYAYGVEWAFYDKEDQRLRSLLFFEHPESQVEDGVYLCRASRVLIGGRNALALGVPLIMVALRGKEGTRYASLTKEVMGEMLTTQYGVREVREGVGELMLRVPDSVLKTF